MRGRCTEHGLEVHDRRRSLYRDRRTATSDQVRAGETDVGEHAGRQHRVRTAALDLDEHRERDHPDRQRAQHQGIPEAVVAGQVRPKVRPASPVVASTAPAMSSLPVAVSSRDSGTCRRVMRTVTSAIGMLSRKISRQDPLSTRLPPTNGPTAAATEVDRTTLRPPCRDPTARTTSAGWPGCPG